MAICDRRRAAASCLVYDLEGTYMTDYFKKIRLRPFIVMLLGVATAGYGISLLRFSNLGTDPLTGMNLALSDLLGLGYPYVTLLVNLTFFIIELLWGREYIGIGTIVNAVLIGFYISAFYDLQYPFFGQIEQGGLPVRILMLIMGILVTGLGFSMYQQSRMGVSPYDSLSLILDMKFEKVPYFVFRIAGDVLCALACYLFGGKVMVGMVVTALGFGPVIQFFDGTVTRVLLGTEKQRG